MNHNIHYNILEQLAQNKRKALFEGFGCPTAWIKHQFTPGLQFYCKHSFTSIPCYQYSDQGQFNSSCLMVWMWWSASSLCNLCRLHCTNPAIYQVLCATRARWGLAEDTTLLLADIKYRKVEGEKRSTPQLPFSLTKERCTIS